MRRALVHPQVPWYAKAVVGCAVLYIVSPIQLIPNFIPIIGQLDDVLVVTLSVKFLRRCVSQCVLDECENDLSTPRKRKALMCVAADPLPIQKS